MSMLAAIAAAGGPLLLRTGILTFFRSNKAEGLPSGHRKADPVDSNHFSVRLS